jgi:hypothetical protein
MREMELLIAYEWRKFWFGVIVVDVLQESKVVEVIGIGRYPIVLE